MEEIWAAILNFFESYSALSMIILIIVVALLARWLLVRLIRKISKDLVKQVKHKHQVDDTQALSNSPIDALRIVQRTRTISNVLTKLVSLSIYIIATIMVLDRLGFPVTALITSAGILGAALAFGAQSLVKDMVSGIFMVFEDQLGIGDLVEMGEISGIVEAVDIRVTQVRDMYGTVWYIRNGEVTEVGNMSQGWSRIILDLPVPYSSDIDRARTIMLETAQEMKKDPDWRHSVLENPEIWGIQTMDATGVVIRLAMKTKPSIRFSGARELQFRIKQALDAQGLGLAVSEKLVIVQGDQNHPVVEGQNIEVAEGDKDE